MGKAIIINDMLFSPNLGSVTISGSGGDSPEPEGILELDYLRFPTGVCFDTGVNPSNTKYYQYEEVGETLVNGFRFGSRISASSRQCGYAILDSSKVRVYQDEYTELTYSAYSSRLTSGVIKINIIPNAYAILQNEEQIAYGNFASAASSSYPLVLGGINLAGTISANQTGAVNIKSFKVYDNGWNNLIYHVMPVLYDGSPCLYDVINNTIASGWNVSADTTVEYSYNGMVSTGTLLLGNS